MVAGGERRKKRSERDIMMLQSMAGLGVFVCLAWTMSEHRRGVRLKGVVIGVLLQLTIAYIFLKIPFCREVFSLLNEGVTIIESASRAGTSFVFGYVGGGELPFTEKYPGAAFIFGFQALPIVLLMSALSSLLFYWKVLPVVVKVFSRVLEKTMGLGGAEGLGVSANIFVGMVEAPLFIRPYLTRMTRSELFSIMTSGMATIAGTVIVLYAGFLKDTVPDALGHILIASIISAPAAITVAKIMIPEQETVTLGSTLDQEPVSGAMDAVTKGTVQGVQLLINIVAMLIVLVALVYLVDAILGLMPQVGNTPLSLQRILGWIMAPVTWLMGVPWNEAQTAGGLMGTKTVLNEFLAYINLSQLPEGALSERSRLIMTYALCGFANPGSLGIMIGGLGTMAPDRRSEIVGLGFRSLVAGTLAACMTGAVVAIIHP